MAHSSTEPYHMRPTLLETRKTSRLVRQMGSTTGGKNERPKPDLDGTPKKIPEKSKMRTNYFQKLSGGALKIESASDI